MPKGPRKAPRKAKVKKAPVKKISPRTKMTNRNTRGSAKRPAKKRELTSDVARKNR